MIFFSIPRSHLNSARNSSCVKTVRKPLMDYQLSKPASARFHIGLIEDCAINFLVENVFLITCSISDQVNEL